MELRKLLTIAALLASACRLCAGVTWETPRDVAGDLDVSTKRKGSELIDTQALYRRV